MPVTQSMSAPPSTFNCLRIGKYHCSAWVVHKFNTEWYWQILFTFCVEFQHGVWGGLQLKMYACSLKFEGCANFAPPCGQVYGHLWVCLDRWCSSRSHESEKVWVQWSNVYGFSPLWTLLWWCCKWPLCLNVLPQSPHSYGHSPVCVSKMCRFLCILPTRLSQVWLINFDIFTRHLIHSSHMKAGKHAHVVGSPTCMLVSRSQTTRVWLRETTGMPWFPSFIVGWIWGSCIVFHSTATTFCHLHTLSLT